MFGEDFMRDFFHRPAKGKQFTEDDVRRVLREELKKARKAGCKNFEMRDGRGFCRNCGFHHNEH